MVVLLIWSNVFVQWSHGYYGGISINQCLVHSFSTKLLSIIQFQRSFQAKQLEEKEEKMIQMLEDKQVFILKLCSRVHTSNNYRIFKRRGGRFCSYFWDKQNTICIIVQNTFIDTRSCPSLVDVWFFFQHSVAFF